MEISLPLLFFSGHFWGRFKPRSLGGRREGPKYLFHSKSRNTNTVRAPYTGKEETKLPVFAAGGRMKQSGRAGGWLDTTTAGRSAVRRLGMNSTPSCFNSAHKGDNKIFLLSDSLAVLERFSSIFWMHSFTLFTLSRDCGATRTSLTC